MPDEVVSPSSLFRRPCVVVKVVVHTVSNIFRWVGERLRFGNMHAVMLQFNRRTYYENEQGVTTAFITGNDDDDDNAQQPNDWMKVVGIVQASLVLSSLFP